MLERFGTVVVAMLKQRKSTSPAKADKAAPKSPKPTKSSTSTTTPTTKGADKAKKGQSPKAAAPAATPAPIKPKFGKIEDNQVRFIVSCGCAGAEVADKAAGTFSFHFFGAAGWRLVAFPPAFHAPFVCFCSLKI